MTIQHDVTYREGSLENLLPLFERLLKVFVGGICGICLSSAMLASAMLLAGKVITQDWFAHVTFALQGMFLLFGVVVVFVFVPVSLRKGFAETTVNHSGSRPESHLAHGKKQPEAPAFLPSGRKIIAGKIESFDLSAERLQTKWSSDR